MENFDAEQPMEDLQEQTPKKEPKNPLYDCYSLLHDLVYILAAITIVFVFFVRLVGVDGPSMMPTLQDGDYVALLSNLFMGDLEQGDVIVARKESFENRLWISSTTATATARSTSTASRWTSPISWNRWCCPTMTARASP